MTPADLRAHVDTIVVVMMENRSFDHMLGFSSHEAYGKRSEIDGLHAHGPQFDCSNPDAAGRLYPPVATPDGYLPADLPHGRRRIAEQIRSGAMDGFIASYFDWQKDRTPAPMRFARAGTCRSPQRWPMSTPCATTGLPRCPQTHRQTA